MRNRFFYKFNNKYVFLLFALLLGIAIGWILGVLTSGYHLIDDHEIIAINKDIKVQGFFNTIIKWMCEDFSIRFRPVYWVIRVSEALLFGENYFLWHMEKCIEVAICIYLTYRLVIRTKNSKLMCIGAIVVTFWGTQAEILWRLGPQELVGLMFLLICIRRLTIYYEKRKYLVLLIIDILLVSGIKESFLLIIPIFILYLYLLNIDENLKVRDNLNRFIKSYWWFVVYILLVFGFSLYFVVFKIGTMKIGYAGVDHNLSITDMLKKMLSIVYGPLQVYIIVSIIVMLLLIVGSVVKRTKVSRQLLFINIIIDAYFLISQIFLHASGGMYSRYKIPCLCIFAVFLFVQAPYYWSQIYENRSYYVIAALVIGTVLIKNENINKELSEYVTQGNELEYLFDYIEEKVDMDNKILLSLGYEADYGCAMFLENLGYDEVYTAYYNSDNELFGDIHNEKAIDKNGLDIYIVDHDIEKDFLERYDMTLKGFERIENSFIDIFVKERIE